MTAHIQGDRSTEEDERTVLGTNVNGLVRTTRLCIPHPRDGGHIVNVGSVAGRWPYENAALYCLSKVARFVSRYQPRIIERSRLK